MFSVRAVTYINLIGIHKCGIPVWLIRSLDRLDGVDCTSWLDESQPPPPAPHFRDGQWNDTSPPQPTIFTGSTHDIERYRAMRDHIQSNFSSFASLAHLFPPSSSAASSTAASSTAAAPATTTASKVKKSFSQYVEERRVAPPAVNPSPPASSANKSRPPSQLHAHQRAAPCKFHGFLNVILQFTLTVRSGAH